jgi:hypothetical protein
MLHLQEFQERITVVFAHLTIFGTSTLKFVVNVLQPVVLSSFKAKDVQTVFTSIMWVMDVYHAVPLPNRLQAQKITDVFAIQLTTGTKKPMPASPVQMEFALVSMIDWLCI